MLGNKIGHDTLVIQICRLLVIRKILGFKIKIHAYLEKQRKERLWYFTFKNMFPV